MSDSQNKLWVVVPAAGVGRRFGADVPKQYLPLLGKSVAEWTVRRLLAVPGIEQLVVAINDQDSWWSDLKLNDSKLSTIIGGAERADSVRLGLESLAGKASESDWVLVHDIARPCVRVSDIQKLIFSIQVDSVGGILASPVADTIKRVKQGVSIDGTEDRSQLWSALTPQMFRYGLLTAALQQAAERGFQPTDEASAVEQLGVKPIVVEGQRDNLKITRREDLVIAEAILNYQQQER